MRIGYLERAAGAAAAADGKGPSALPAIGGTLAAAAVVVGIAWLLFPSLSLENSTSYSVSYSGVRTAITQALDKDLAADRIQEVLTDLPDARPETAGNTRKTDRAARLKSMAARISGDRARLADNLTLLALESHPGLLAEVTNAADPAARRQKMAEIVTGRLATPHVRGAALAWLKEAVDPRTREGFFTTVAAMAPDIADGERVAVEAIASSLSFEALRRSVARAIAPSFNAFDPRPAESAWTSDVTARLAWAVVALLFTLTFGILAVASLAQVLPIEHRNKFIAVALIVAGAAGAGAYVGFNPANGLTPLHEAFDRYALLFRTGILDWAQLFNALRGAGVALLVAGSVATFWLKVATLDELKAQLLGFKGLFNAGAIFLMVGTLEVYAGFRWPIVFAADEATRTALQSAANSFAATIGAAFSVVMLATYFATTFFLRRQAIAHGVPGADVNAAFAADGFGDNLSAQLFRFAQALSPLLPGAFSLLLQ